MKKRLYVLRSDLSVNVIGILFLKVTSNIVKPASKRYYSFVCQHQYTVPLMVSCYSRISMILAEGVVDYQGLCNENPPKAGGARKDRLKTPTLSKQVTRRAETRGQASTYRLGVL
jgi:hypothetical protein